MPIKPQSVFIYILFTSLLFSHITCAKDFAKPPSVALRNEVSYVSDVTLNKITPQENNTVVLQFILNADLHNHADKVTSIAVPKTVAKKLELNNRYLIAYQKVKKTKVKGINRYVQNDTFLINVEGANPAIFKYNDYLHKQLTHSPQRIKTEPQQLLADIFIGMSHKDPKIQDFFVRELINWDALHLHLKPSHYTKLMDVYLSGETNTTSLIAILENRKHLHNNLGIKNLKPKAMNILQYHPVILDISSNVPTLILQILNFMETNQLSDWATISRWTRSNSPTIAERALLILKKIDPDKAVKLARTRQSQTLLSETTRRVLRRFISQNPTKISKDNNQ